PSTSSCRNSNILTLRGYSMKHLRKSVCHSAFISADGSIPWSKRSKSSFLLLLAILTAAFTLTNVCADAPFTFSYTGSLSTARTAYTATLLQNGKVLVAGGQDASGVLASAELYDPATGIWSATGSLHTGRKWHTATLLPNGKVLVAAGFDNNVNFN